MKSHTIDSGMIDSVVEHMNEDHSDACVVIVKALGHEPDIVSATMYSMNAEGADFRAQYPDGSEKFVRILFDKPVSRDSQVRGHLVALTKRARAMQEQSTN